MKLRRLSALMATALPLLAAPASAQNGAALDDAWLDGFRWRSVGPANMSGRITDIEGIPSPSKTFYVATVAGGIWKTTNNGVTFQPLFQNERVVSMGDIEIAPSDPNQIWAGTGEEDSRNSISPGGGIYKSTDGGLTWELKGLEATEHIGKVVVHPTNPDVVWVAALGAHWRTNPERGLYKTNDGGDTWRQVKFVSDRAGFVDIALHPENPDVLLASSWERQRGPYYLESGGPGSALWKSTDGGETWTEIEGGGLPETMLGRIGISYAPSDPDIVYAIVEAAAPEGEEERLSGLYRSEDGGRTWERTNRSNSRPFYYSNVYVDPQDPDRVYFSSFDYSSDGGRTSGDAALAVHVDFHAMWIDPNDPERLVVGNDGGIAISFDRGGNYWFPNNIAIGQFYNVSYDMDVPYNVCGGLQDNYSWCGPSRKADDVITKHDWFRVSGGDGFVTQQDPRDPNIVYSESQGGNMGRSNLATGGRQSLGTPEWRESYRLFQDSIAMLWPDSTQPMPEEHRARIEDLQRRASADSASLQLRYNWNTPYFLSPHDPDVLYAGANRVLKSTDRGDHLVPISPDLSRQDEEKIHISTETTGGITPDATGAETFATIVSLAESPVRRGVLYAGTDDGNLWISRNDGETWNDLTARLDGLVPDGSYVSRIEPSHHLGERFYVTVDNHRRGDFTPYVLVSDDDGRTFRSIASNLPTGKPDFAHVIREDLVNPNLLFVGTDVGLYVSLDRGGSWQRFMENFPTVPVHDLQIHPREGELIAATHGRSLWITDIRPLQQMTPAVLASDAHLFDPGVAHHFGTSPTGGEFTGQAYFMASSPEYGASLRYWIGADTDDEVEIVVEDARGHEMWRDEGEGTRGLHEVTWELTGQETRFPLSASERRDSIATEKRLAEVADSLVDAGHDEDEVGEVVADLHEPSSGGGGFGGGDDDDDDEGLVFTADGRFVERAAEGEPSPGLEEDGDEEGEDSLREEIVRLVRGDEGGGRRGRRGRRGSLFPVRTEDGPLADPGEYTITLRVGDEEYTQTLRVERSESAPSR